MILTVHKHMHMHAPTEEAVMLTLIKLIQYMYMLTAFVT